MAYVDQIHHQKNFCNIVQLALQQSAESLTRMLHSPVGIDSGILWKGSGPPSVPETVHDAKGSGIFLNITGDIAGALFFHLPEDSSDWLVQQLLGLTETGKPLSETACSALKETGNVVASSFLSAIENRFGIHCLPTPPKLLQGTLTDLFSSFGLTDDTPGIVVETPFFGQETSPGLRGTIYLFTELDTVKQLLALVD